MSATPTRPDHEGATASAQSAALGAGNRALESISRHEALRSLLAFSELHDRIRQRRAGKPAPDDLSQTERFVLDEVLQLICDRALSVTGAHGVMIALAEGTQIVCRASSGTVLVERGLHLPIDSEFLAECLVTGQIVRCDDAETDSRITHDTLRRVGATSSVLVPLRGTNARLGVLQAFSRLPRGFSEGAVRSLDLFAELVLSALKPEDQDRRINWLADLADQVLSRRPPSGQSQPLRPVELEIKAEAKPALKTPPRLLEVPPPAKASKPHEENKDAIADAPAKKQSVVLESAPETITPAPSFLPESSLETSRPWIRVFGAVAAVAVLFCVGVWWGMRGNNEKALSTPGVKLSSAESSAPTASDNLMDPAKFSPQTESSAASSGRPLPRITGIRHWGSAMGSTVVLDMEGQVPYEVHRLTKPERIYFDLHDSNLAKNIDGQTIEVGDAALARVRIAQPVPGVTRLVLDTGDGTNFSVSMETNPYRFVIDLRADDHTAVAKASHSKSTPAVVAQAPKLSDEHVAARTGKLRIVLDAGHGGWDLGTVGRQGLLEKDLVLDVTQRLGALLQQRLGADIVFTRSGDDYLPLEQRADLANQAQADLFVSVHANYSSSANARGVETYYSNFFAAPGSKEIEKRENEGVVNPVSISVSASALQAKIEDSRKLAAQVQHSLYAALAPRNPDIRNRGIKDAAFVVLTGTTMPAILTEISFVSSPADERNLQSESYREQIAEALYKGIAHYEETTLHAKVAQLRQTTVQR